MEQEVIILSADAWSMVDEKTGELRSGVSCFYIPVKDLKPLKNSDTSFGVKPLKASMPPEFIKEIEGTGCPVQAKALYVMRVSNGQQVLKVDEFIFKK